MRRREEEVTAVVLAIACLAETTEQLSCLAVQLSEEDEVEVDADYFAAKATKVSEALMKADAVFESDDGGGGDDDDGLPLEHAQVFQLRKVASG